MSKIVSARVIRIDVSESGLSTLTFRVQFRTRFWPFWRYVMADGYSSSSYQRKFSKLVDATQYADSIFGCVQVSGVATRTVVHNAKTKAPPFDYVASTQGQM